MKEEGDERNEGEKRALKVGEGGVGSRGWRDDGERDDGDGGGRGR